jgi:two-component system, sensor histidine kinase and response regulator
MNNTSYRILVIEDEQYICENIQELLVAKDYKVRVASNGREGILEAIDYKPHLIICDIMIPKMDGFKVLEYIRKTSALQNVPFIFLSAKIDKADIRLGMELGADDYITKPFSAKELINSIETRLKRYEKVNKQFNTVKHELETQVFSNYHHEFNTPLHGIIGGLNLLISARNNFSENQEHDLHVSILKSAIRLNHSIANLMLYEEIKRAEVHTELITMFCNGQSVGNWAFQLEQELIILAKEIYKREADLYVSLESAEININTEFLLRIILEVTDNAFKFSKQGYVVQVTGKKEKEWYIILIKDEGIGFEKDTIKCIAPFKQFKRNKLEQQGLGIGLHLVKNLIELNRGELYIESSETKGTTVQMKLPLLDTE